MNSIFYSVLNSATLASLLLSATGTAYAAKQWALASIEGEIIQVTPLPAKASGATARSEITVHADVACYQYWENFSHSEQRNSDGSLDIIAAIVVSQPADPTARTCSGTRIAEKNLRVDGIFDQSQVKIRFLHVKPLDNAGLSFVMPSATAGVKALGDIKIEKVSQNCLAGVPCPDKATRIVLSTSMPCMNSLAGLAFETEQVGKDIVVYLYGAEFRSNYSAICTDVRVGFELTAYGKFAASEKNIKLVLLN